MRSILSRILARVTYANVTATLALFVALGGTGYAAFTLPRDSVGGRELRPRAVGHSELDRNAVRSENVRNGTLGLQDLSSDARQALAGERGPAGPAGVQGVPGPRGDNGAAGKDAVALWALVDSSGGKRGGTATAATRTALGDYRVSFAQSASGCAYSATLARVEGGLVVDPPPGRVTVADDSGDTRVRTYGTGGASEDIGFHLIVVC